MFGEISDTIMKKVIQSVDWATFFIRTDEPYSDYIRKMHIKIILYQRLSQGASSYEERGTGFIFPECDVVEK